jgi:hypothetical protein
MIHGTLRRANDRDEEPTARTDTQDLWLEAAFEIEQMKFRAARVRGAKAHAARMREVAATVTAATTPAAPAVALGATAKAAPTATPAAGATAATTRGSVPDGKPVSSAVASTTVIATPVSMLAPAGPSCAPPSMPVLAHGALPRARPCVAAAAPCTSGGGPSMPVMARGAPSAPHASSTPGVMASPAATRVVATPLRNTSPTRGMQMTARVHKRMTDAARSLELARQTQAKLMQLAESKAEVERIARVRQQKINWYKPRAGTMSANERRAARERLYRASGSGQAQPRAVSAQPQARSKMPSNATSHGQYHVEMPTRYERGTRRHRSPALKERAHTSGTTTDRGDSLARRVQRPSSAPVRRGHAGYSAQELEKNWQSSLIYRPPPASTSLEALDPSSIGPNRAVRQWMESLRDPSPPPTHQSAIV